eukprot:3333463-Rhodomonas_salina.2
MAGTVNAQDPVGLSAEWCPSLNEIDGLLFLSSQNRSQQGAHDAGSSKACQNEFSRVCSTLCEASLLSSSRKDLSRHFKELCGQIDCRDGVGSAQGMWHGVLLGRGVAVCGLPAAASGACFNSREL